jgi:hypothetical protein
LKTIRIASAQGKQKRKKKPGKLPGFSQTAAELQMLTPAGG